MSSNSEISIDGEETNGIRNYEGDPLLPDYEIDSKFNLDMTPQEKRQELRRLYRMLENLEGNLEYITRKIEYLQENFDESD